MRCTRTRWPAVLATAGCVLIPAAAAAVPPMPGAVVRIEVPHDAGVRAGVAFVVHAATLDGRPVVYFLTMASLFPVHRGDLARLLLTDGVREVRHSDIFTPPDHAGVAVIRLADAPPGLAPFAVTFAAVSAGRPFVLWGRDAAGLPCVASGAIGAVSTRRLTADRHMTSGCLAAGAPVSDERGVFAVAVEPDTNGPAAFLPLAAARSFVLRHVPGLDARTEPPPQFQLTSRDVAGPTLEVAAGETRDGVLRVPLRLESSEVALDATARVVDRRALRLADVRIVSVEDRTVTLRFSIGGAPPPVGPAPWPVGQALIVLRVHLLSPLTP